MARTIDTRFFLTHYIADSEQVKAKTAKRMVELQKETAIVPTIVLHEVFKFMHDNIGKDVAYLRVNSVLSAQFEIVELTSKIAVTSALLRCRYRNLPTADSIVAATSIEKKSKRVVSDDPHFKEIDEIHCEWL